MADDLAFRPVVEGDLSLLARWLARPHVERWWPDPVGALASITRHLNEPHIDSFVMIVGGRDAGYLQSYDPHAWPNHPFGDSPPGSRGLDMFIGEPDLIGRGHGARVTRRFVEGLFDEGVPQACIDPHPDNVIAIKAYTRAGFVAYGERETEWGRVLLMRQSNPRPVRISGNRAI